MIQLVFDASTAEEALHQSPVEVGYSQHEGAERAAWNDPKLERVGTHPVVHPADGSHANFYGEGLYLGSSASEGVGCDDTRGPTVDVRPTVVTIPSAGAAARSQYPWIAFEGRWGELRPAFFNGPEGPNLKTQWTHPITWAEDWRSRSYTVPGGTVFGSGATGFFCSAVARGLAVARAARGDPGRLQPRARRARPLHSSSCSPGRPGARLRRSASPAAARGGRRSRRSARMYVARWPLFVGLGVVFVPIGLLVSLLQALLLHTTSVFAVEVGHGSGGVVAFVALALGTTLTLLGLGLVLAATARALLEIDAGRPVGPLRAYRLSLLRAPRLFGALLIAVVVVSLLASSLLPAADRRLARRPLGARRPCGGAGGRPRARRAPPQPPPRQEALAEGRVPRGLRRRARPLARPARRRAAHPRDERAFWLVNVVAGVDLRAGDALCRAHDRIPLLRLPRPRRVGSRRRSATGFRPRSGFRADRDGRRQRRRTG